jgi:hypothetical protein
MRSASVHPPRLNFAPLLYGGAVMAKLKMLPAAILAVAAAIAVPATAKADGYRYGPGVPYGYAPPALGYAGPAVPYLYEREYRRAERRAEREIRRQLKREAKAYRKLRRAYERYEAAAGYPYAFDPYAVPYRLAGDGYRFRRFRRGDDD